MTISRESFTNSCHLYLVLFMLLLHLALHLVSPWVLRVGGRVGRSYRPRSVSRQKAGGAGGNVMILKRWEQNNFCGTENMQGHQDSP